MKREFRSEQRISNMMMAHGGFKDDDIRRVYYAFDKLIILKSGFILPVMRMNEQTFYLKKEEYVAKMEWINEFVRSKGMDVVIFTNTDDFATCVKDYDYYYEFKTPSQYRKEEEERGQKAYAPAGQRRSAPGGVYGRA